MTWGYIYFNLHILNSNLINNIFQGQQGRRGVVGPPGDIGDTGPQGPEGPQVRMYLL